MKIGMRFVLPMVLAAACSMPFGCRAETKEVDQPKSRDAGAETTEVTQPVGRAAIPETTAVAQPVVRPASAETTEVDPPMLRAAIFVQNRASADFQNSVDTLNDLITTKLTEKGFSIIDKDLVIPAFKESRDDQNATREEQKAAVDNLAVVKTEATVEDVLTSASALRIAQMINADYLVIATITSAGHETREFKGKGTAYGSDMKATIYTMRISLKVIEGRQGGSVYGDVVTATEKVAKTENYESESTDIVNKLLDDGSTLIADRVEAKVPRIRKSLDNTPALLADFSIDCNIVNATVELDGAAIGTTPGRFKAPPGLHQLRISHEWYATWSKTANIYPNQTLKVDLELSNDGFKRFQRVEEFKVAMEKEYQNISLKGLVTTSQVEMAKIQSDAEAYAKMRIAEGEKTMREHSWIHDDGLANSINKILGR